MKRYQHDLNLNSSYTFGLKFRGLRKFLNVHHGGHILNKPISEYHILNMADCLLKAFSNKPIMLIIRV